MTDTHCHLTDERLAAQIDDVLARATAAGVGQIITIGTDIEDSRQCVELCRKRQNIRCAIGVHPSYINEGQSVDLLRPFISDLSVKAIGEIGLDYYWEKDAAKQKKQHEFLSLQLQLASTFGKPVVIHCRDAVADCLAIMKDFPQIRAVFHCFTGTLPEADVILEAGYYLGFTGVVTFKKNQELRNIARMAPADRILIETDAPYLTPEPMRKQKVNEPAMVVHTAKAIAKTREITIDEMEKITDENARTFFSL